jgi:hypothetical protein
MTRIEKIKEMIDSLTEEERLEIMQDYCPYCGGHKPCVCWKDE